tara:strand:- start:19 stop:963 length:945 start_codon:yes stop_codon:yes gene_type:complete
MSTPGNDDGSRKRKREASLLEKLQSHEKRKMDDPEYRKGNTRQQFMERETIDAYRRSKALSMVAFDEKYNDLPWKKCKFLNDISISFSHHITSQLTNINSVYEVALLARRENLLTNFGLPPPRTTNVSVSGSSSGSSTAAVQTQLLSAVADITAASQQEVRSQGVRPSPSISRQSVLQRTLQGHDLDFSCGEGDFIALLAPSQDSHGYQFWVAEAAASIQPPRNEEEAKRAMVKVFYFKARDKDYLVFNLEERKRVESSVRETPYDTALTRIMNVTRERGVTTRISISEQERNRLRDLALKERVNALNNLQSTT